MTQPLENAVFCPDCHALVEDLDAHKRWHGRLVSDLAKAIEKEYQRLSGLPH
jgi:hypothetical protein